MVFERMDTVCLAVSNLEKSIEWYESIGLKKGYRGENYQVFQIGDSPVSLTIEEVEVLPGERMVYPIFFAKNVLELQQLFKEKGINVSEVQTDGVNTFFSFYDLDNNKLQVCYWN